MEYLIILAILVFVIGPRTLVSWNDRIDDLRRRLRGEPPLSREERERRRGFRQRVFLRLENSPRLGWSMIAAGLALAAANMLWLHWGPTLYVVAAVLLFVGPWLL